MLAAGMGHGGPEPLFHLVGWSFFPGKEPVCAGRAVHDRNVRKIAEDKVRVWPRSRVASISFLYTGAAGTVLRLKRDVRSAIGA